MEVQLEIRLRNPWRLKRIEADPVENLNLDPSMVIQPGNLLLAYPPFCFAEASNSSITEISLDEVHVFHAEIASKIRDLGDGEKIEFRLE